MLKKVVYVALLVSDQDKALDFYTDVIGLEKRLDAPTPVGPRFLTVGVKGQDLDLVLWPGTPARADVGSAVYTSRKTSASSNTHDTRSSSPRSVASPTSRMSPRTAPRKNPTAPAHTRTARLVATKASPPTPVPSRAPPAPSPSNDTTTAGAQSGASLRRSTHRSRRRRCSVRATTGRTPQPSESAASARIAASSACRFMLGGMNRPLRRQ
jgi:hypothetical protein